MRPARYTNSVTALAVILLAGIAAVVSYSHMFELALRHGEPQWRAALFPLSVDGMIVASSMSLLSDARQGRRGGLLPWLLLIVGSAASLCANVAVAEPTLWSRVIHAWPSFALMGAYELLMRQFRAGAHGEPGARVQDEPVQPIGEAQRDAATERAPSGTPAAPGEEVPLLDVVGSADREAGSVARLEVPRVQEEAWNWALQHRSDDGSLPSGKEIAAHFARKDRWGRLVKQRGQRGYFGDLQRSFGFSDTHREAKACSALVSR